MDGALGDEKYSPGNYPFFLSKLAVAISEALDAASAMPFLDDVDSVWTLEEAADRLYQTAELSNTLTNALMMLACFVGLRQLNEP